MQGYRSCTQFWLKSAHLSYVSTIYSKRTKTCERKEKKTTSIKSSAQSKFGWSRDNKCKHYPKLGIQIRKTCENSP